MPAVDQRETGVGASGIHPIVKSLPVFIQQLNRQFSVVDTIAASEGREGREGMRGDLWAKVSRPVFYDLVNLIPIGSANLHSVPDVSSVLYSFTPTITRRCCSISHC